MKDRDGETPRTVIKTYPSDTWSNKDPNELQYCLPRASALTGRRLPSLAFVVPYIGTQTKTLSVAQLHSSNERL